MCDVQGGHTGDSKEAEGDGLVAVHAIEDLRGQIADFVHAIVREIAAGNGKECAKAPGGSLDKFTGEILSTLGYSIDVGISIHEVRPRDGFDGGSIDPFFEDARELVSSGLILAEDIFEVSAQFGDAQQDAHHRLKAGVSVGEQGRPEERQGRRHPGKI